MKLNVLDRVIGIQALAGHTKFDFATYKTLEGLRHKLLINEEEVKKYDFITENNSYSWNPLGFTESVDFDLSEMEIQLLREGLIKIAERKELTDNHIPLCKKIVPDLL